jgi:glycosyltransferase involved in cell wall biosynthesis
MRLAIFTELYSPSIGGQEAFFAGLARAMQRRGHKVDVYCVRHEEELPLEVVIDGIPVHRVPVASRYKEPRWRGMRRSWPAILQYSWHVRGIAQRDDHDFYLLNQWPLLHVPLLPRRARRRAMLHWCEVRNGRFFDAVQAWLPVLVGMNAAISDPVGQEIQVASGAKTMLTLPSGLDLSKSSSAKRNDRSDLVVLGRIAPHKNLPMIVDAFERLRSAGYAGRLKIAGEGPAMAELRARLEASPARESIDLLGFVTDEQKFALMSKAEVLAVPSMREGFPHVVAEAMSCGLPIVTMNYPENGTKDVVELFGSGTVTARSAQSLAEGIQRALAEWEDYSRKGLTAARWLDWNLIAERLERHLGTVAALAPCVASVPRPARTVP